MKNNESFNDNQNNNDINEGNSVVENDKKIDDDNVNTDDISSYDEDKGKEKVIHPFLEKSKKYLLSLMITMLILLFTFIGVYEISFRYMNKKLSESSISILNKNLEDDTVVILQSQNGSKGTNIDKIYTIKEIKKKYDMTGDVTRDDIEKIFKKQNYSIESDSNVRLVFNRKSSKYTVGKYYIGEKDGYLAIYKCNEEGDLIIEDENKDIYKNFTKVSSLDDISQKMIKNHEKSYNTKEEAEEDITEYI